MRNCDSCQKELTPVFPDLGRRKDDFPQYENALVIDLKGGYGMLIDEYIPSFVICRDCGIKLVAINPMFVTPETQFLVEMEVDA